LSVTTHPPPRPSSRPPAPLRISSRPPSASPESGELERLQEIYDLIEIQDGSAQATFGEYTLRTAIQPVLSLVHHKPVGHEALLRAYDQHDRLVAPNRVFMKAGEQATHLDQVCRALHVQNFALSGLDQGWILLNVSPRLVLEGHSTRMLLPRILERHGVPPHRVVVEILETSVYDESNLARSVRFFRELGCLVAIDDFGAGESNFERIWRIQPDIVKLDRSMVVEATRTRRVRRILPGLVSLLHEAGCLVVMEGLETSEHALIALESDADFVQGYYFGEPRLRPGARDDPQGILSGLLSSFEERVLAQSLDEREVLTRYRKKFEAAADRFQLGVNVDGALSDFLDLEAVQRCYLVSADGVQVGSNFAPRAARQRPDPRYQPCSDADGANWFRRPYFRRAIGQPGVVQVSRPYLSIADGRTCITFSIAIPETRNVRVLCADLDWEALLG
jgi:EAL domain-containing protein (putative c-di-GMP-specific phosphodiesterase class I)